jgi:hypothetical protein
LNDDAILLNLSPARTPNGNRVMAASGSVMSGGSNDNSGKPFFSAEDLGHDVTGRGQYNVTYRDGKSAANSSSNNNNNLINAANNGNNNNNGGTRTSWYLELVGCLRPVLSFMGKEKQANQITVKGKDES